MIRVSNTNSCCGVGEGAGPDGGRVLSACSVWWACFDSHAYPFVEHAGGRGECFEQSRRDQSPHAGRRVGMSRNQTRGTRGSVRVVNVCIFSLDQQNIIWLASVYQSDDGRIGFGLCPKKPIIFIHHPSYKCAADDTLDVFPPSLSSSCPHSMRQGVSALKGVCRPRAAAADIFLPSS